MASKIRYVSENESFPFTHYISPDKGNSWDHEGKVLEKLEKKTPSDEQIVCSEEQKTME